MRNLFFVSAAVVAAVCFTGCKKEAPVPVLTVDSESVTTFPLSGGQGSVKYSVENAVEGTVAVATTEADWITDIKADDAAVTFTVAENKIEQPREADIILSYGDAVPVKVKVSQASALTFNIEIKTLWANKIVYEVTPSDLAYTYVVSTMSKELADKKTDEEIVAADVARFTAENPFTHEKGTIDKRHFVEDSFGGYWEGDVWEGTQTVTDNSVSDFVKTYYIIVYGLDLEGNMTSPKVTRIPFETAVRSVLKVDEFKEVVPVEGGSYKLNYSVENPKEGEEVSYSLGFGGEFIQDIKIDTENHTISFTVPKNEDKPSWSWTTNRSGTINVSYADAEKASITVKQKYAE